MLLKPNMMRYTWDERRVSSRKVIIPMIEPTDDPDMLDEYDFSNGTRGKYAARYAEGTNVVLLDPDVAAYFPDGAAVNSALRHLVAVIESQRKSDWA